MARQWHELRRFSADRNLSDVNAFLIGQGIAHMFTEEGGEQVLWLANPQEQALVDDFLNRYLNGNIQICTPAKQRLLAKPEFLDFAVSYPLTSVMLVLGFLGFIVGDVIQNIRLFSSLAFWPMDKAIFSGQVWRLVTPTFLHFSIAHFALNAVWIFILGRKLEVYLGAKRYGLFFLFSAVVANAMQFYIVGANNFGGLSGVVYAFIGALCISNFVIREPLLYIPRGLLIFSVIALAVGFTGAMDWIAGTGIAHWAHLGGFLSGLVFFIVVMLFKEVKHDIG